ncbi:MoxR-like ATPase [Patulibacter medicamentivorans]|uniref:MoxR-like ATPase n=1 Tax=Patulibacter medicamentivorans TaxID=1097667 RepID=H0E595_9ACTN|nr:MoxR-like ATPase [Patulibacter medicamentivorans]
MIAVVRGQQRPDHQRPEQRVGVAERGVRQPPRRQRHRARGHQRARPAGRASGQARRADHRQQRPRPRDDQPGEGRPVAEDRRRPGDQQRERLERRSGVGVEREAPDLAPPDDPGRGVEGQRAAERQRRDRDQHGAEDPRGAAQSPGAGLEHRAIVPQRPGGGPAPNREDRGDRARAYDCSPVSDTPATVEDLDAGLRSVGYLPGARTSLVSHLAIHLDKPVLVEGPAGVGKTELAKALASVLDRDLIRLQCYEGLDEAKALYEWNYRKQLLRIQAETGSSGGDGEGWSQVQDDVFGEEFLLTRPLLQAIASERPVVLLIDEIDKTDQEFEAMLLELLSDFQITIPELGRIEATTQPVVLLTSNNTRELTEALKRRCLYLWLDYPELEHELEIVRQHVPDLPGTISRRLVEVVSEIRNLELKKPPSIAESIDWARTLLLLGATDLDQQLFRDTLSVIVKHRTDIDLVSERVGLRLPARAAE